MSEENKKRRGPRKTDYEYSTTGGNVLTGQETAARLKCSISFLYKLMNRGELKRAPLKKSPLFKQEPLGFYEQDVEALLLKASDEGTNPNAA
jgi:hypothetical protein